MDQIFKIELQDTVELEYALLKLKNFPVLLVWRRFYAYYRKVLRERYLYAASVTPFAPASYGRTKPVSGRVIPDGQFGIDSGALYADITQNVRLSQGELSVWSDRSYAAYIMAKFAEKGPYSPESILFADDADLDELAGIVDELIPQDLRP